MKEAPNTAENENECQMHSENAQNNETTPTAVATVIAVEALSNQETDIAAMVVEDLPNTTPPPTPNTTITTTIPSTIIAATAANDVITPQTLQYFAIPATPPQVVAASAAQCGSLKKKRNKSATKRRNTETRRDDIAPTDVANTSVQSSGSNIKTSLSMTSLPPDEEEQESRDVIKAKLRIERPYNSLKKNAERSAGNNLLGCTPGVSNNKHHRYSWGSSGGHSHSSSSLHSSATLGLGSGKDDLWAAIQTNYNYIMDTNLLDTCKEARVEIEGAASVMENPIECCFKLLDETHRSEGLSEDPKELRKWLREMEHKLENAPSVSEATLFSISELQRHLAEHSVLYHEIVSHARVVSACIRAASEREQQQQQQLLQQQQSLSDNASSIAEQNNSSLSSTDEPTTTTKSSSSGIGTSNTNNTCELKSTILSAVNSTSTSIPIATTTNTTTTTTAATKRSEGNLERLQNRYHLLYLKAFEVQLWLDGLLRKKGSSASILNDDDIDIDDEDDSSECDTGATEDDLNDVASDLESDITHNSSSFCEEDLQHCSTDNEQEAASAQTRDSIQTKGDCEDGDDEEEEDEDEVDSPQSKRDWPNLGYSAVVVTYDKSAGNNGRGVTLTDFEADSESSDFEIVQHLRRQRKISHELRFNSYAQQQQKVVCAASLAHATTLATATTTLETNKAIAQATTLPTTNTLENFAHDTNTAANVVVSMDSIFYRQHEHTTIATSTPMQTKMSINAAAAGEQQHATFLHLNKVAATATTSSTMTTTVTAATAATQTQQMLQTLHSNNKLATTTPTKPKSIAVISPNSHNSGGIHNNKSPVMRKRQQQRHGDISKFNRSNRKSKNCAIFYFKHLDTDNETNYGGGGCGGGSGGLSSSASHASDILKSADASSDDDEGWLYSSAPAAINGNDCLNSTIISNNNNISSVVVDGIQSSTVSSSTAVTTAIISDDSDKENKEAAAATQRNVNLSLSSSLNSATQIAIAEIQLTANASPTTTSTSIISNSSSCSNSSSNCDSSCSSNDLLTEATTTSATTTTQITQMHHCQSQQQQQQQPRLLLHRSEMELQINGNTHTNNNNNNRKTMHIISSNCSANSHNNNNNNNHNSSSSSSTEMRNALPQQQQQLQCEDTNGNSQKDKLCFYTRADICNITVKPSDMQPLPHPHPGKRLPPRSPAKSHNSFTSNGSITAMSATKGKVSHESIKQLVLEAEHLVRDEALKTPSKQKHSHLKISSTVKKREVIMPGPTKQRVQEWLEHQPATPVQLRKSHDLLSVSPRSADDCEASGEASETDSIPQPGSDTSEGFTDSIATCMQTSTNSYGNSTERIGGSAEPIIGANGGAHGSSNQSLNVNVNKIVKRQQTRRKSERPWSVSCLSQLTTDNSQVSTNVATVCDVLQTGLATHSISESALDSLSPGRPRVSSASATNVAHAQPKNGDNKGSLKRRKTRKKKLSYSAASAVGKKTESGSEGSAQELPKLSQSLLMKSCESMSAQQLQEITSALMSLQKNSSASSNEQLANIVDLSRHSPKQTNESGEENSQLMKPNFRVGCITTAYMASEKRLGSLAALATYMHDEEQQGIVYTTGTEDHHSSLSETAWDDYQEKYNSENYSEGFDSDAARRLMEFGDDYRNFIDSQSDCCSSLSAANNLDSLSPPRMDSLQPNETKIITQDTIVSSVDHVRRRRALELEYERRRKTLEVRRKSCQDSSDNQNLRSPTISLSSSANALTPKNVADKFHFQHKISESTHSVRKLEFGMSHSAQSLRRTSESDTSSRRRKADERRRSSRNLEKCIKLIPATSSSSCDDSEDEKEMRNLLQQSRNRLEDTRSLKIRCHLLRPEDYAEIINTCRDNLRCLEAVLRGPPGTVLSTQCVGQTRDLLTAWEDLLGWSENAAAARKMQQEMIILKIALNRLGNKSSFELLDTEPSIQIAIEALKNEKSQLQTYRTNMLRLNASVHSWLTRQEHKLQAALAEQQLKEAADTMQTSSSSSAAVLTEEQEEAESEQTLEQSKSSTTTTTTTTATTTITVTDSNGNQVETHATNTSVNTSVGTQSTLSDKCWDINTLMSSESEFHKHLKDEVSAMYTEWDEADARINSQLEVLTNSLVAWRQLECGLSEFQYALGQDRGTLKGLEGALDKGQATPVELAQNVKLVAKLLSEKVHVSQEQLTAVQEHLDPNHILHIAKFTASNGSLSDSGISDGGATSDGGLSERERRLGVLRRLAKQLESALAPGSEAMKSIAARMESAEAELKNLQNTCRDLIVRTAATHQNKKQQQLEEAQQKAKDTKSNGHAVYIKENGVNGFKKVAATTPTEQPDQNASLKRKNKRKQRNGKSDQAALETNGKSGKTALTAGAPDAGDPADDPALEFELDTSDDEERAKTPKNRWAWRIAKVAVPMQLALFTFLCAACLMQPNCCDNLNNLSMSFTPQLRYIRGPPPI